MAALPLSLFFVISTEVCIHTSIHSHEITKKSYKPLFEIHIRKATKNLKVDHIMHMNLLNI